MPLQLSKARYTLSLVDQDAFLTACRSIGIELSDAQVRGFATFEDALYEANEVMNLTRVPRQECYVRHFLDSLLLGKVLRDLGAGTKILDIGTGPGFPSWCLACAFPDWQISSMDSNGKMLGFLRSQSLPNLEVLEGRAEESGLREKFDVVTGRAVAPLSVQLEISAAPARVGGYVVPMRTPQDDFTGPWIKLGLELIEVREIALPGTDILRDFPILKKNFVTPRSYPRRWAEIKKGPL